MKNNDLVSSAKALDDYFNALLKEDDSLQNQEIESKEYLSAFERVFIPTPRAISLVSSVVFNTTLTQEERDLTLVEQLLSQLKFDECAPELLNETTMNVNLNTDIAVDSVLKFEKQTDIDITCCEVLPFVDVKVSAENVNYVVDFPVELIVIEQNNTESQIKTDINVEPETALIENTTPPWKNIAFEYAFQVLFFESVNVIYAVPLAELGGIHRLANCSYLLGRPNWHLGLQIEQKKQIDVVDTAKWVMSEKIAGNSHRDDYNYVVMLGDSKWGLACNALLGTELLNKEEVKWREQAGKRPWLAGLVKGRMCALIHVEALIVMLNQGIDANALAKLT